MEWYIKALKNYVNFSGRARRKEYWMFFLFNAIFAMVATIIDRAIGSDLSFGGNTQYGVFSLLYSLFILLPGLSITFRRLHDIDKSGFWILISFIPVIGAIVLFVFTVLNGTSGDNKYGADPKLEENIQA